jgi:hypothetical protein
VSNPDRIYLEPDTGEPLPGLPMGLVANPVRVHGLRRQLDELDRIRAFAETLSEHDYQRWRAALARLHQAVAMDLAADAQAAHDQGGSVAEAPCNPPVLGVVRGRAPGVG